MKSAPTLEQLSECQERNYKALNLAVKLKWLETIEWLNKRILKIGNQINNHK